MDEYVLYLDESENDAHFLIGGIIIKKTQIDVLEQGIHNIKECIWDNDYIQENTPILHCFELTSIKDERHNKRKLRNLSAKYPTYSILASKTPREIKGVYDRVYSKFCALLKQIDGVIIGCVIDKGSLSYLYGDNIIRKKDLLFDIAFGEVIENYSYYLKVNNSVGSIIYESRNGIFDLTEKSKDFKMFDTFCKIKSCNKGILFTDEDTIAKTIRYLEVYRKTLDIAGLQFADFVAYNLLRCERIQNEADRTEFMKKLNNRLYNGIHETSEKDLRWYFGLKRLPFNYQKMFELENRIKKLSKAYDNLKTDRNNLLNKKKILEESKRTIVAENIALKNENEILKGNIDKTQ